MDDPFSGWAEAPENLRLTRDEVHVWGWQLAGDAAQLARLRATLSEDELARMRAFHFVADAERFVWARGGLRAFLGQYVGATAEAIRFVYGEYGKPELAKEQSGVHFNLSHTEAVAVAAFSRAGPVGIDVEERHPVSRSLGTQVFSRRELRMMESFSNDEYNRAFFNLWTRKEAIAKAEGVGLYFPMQAFSVCLLPGGLSQIEDPGEVLSREWRLVELTVSGSIAGCLAATGSPTLKMYRWLWQELPNSHCT